jgi:hypothetical protein
MRRPIKGISRRGGRLAVVLDGMVLTSPKITSIIDDEPLILEVGIRGEKDNFTEATRIARDLRNHY